MRFLWVTEGGNFIVEAKDRERATRIVLKERIDCGENLKTAVAHFQKNDDLIAIDEPFYEEDSPYYKGKLPDDLDYS